MKLVHPILSSPLIFEEDKINLLIIENTKMLGHLIHELFDQVNGQEGKFVLSQGSDLLEISKNVEILIDFFNLDCNQKKVLNRLYNALSALATEEKNYLRSTEIFGSVEQYITEILEQAKIPLICRNTIDAGLLFKAANVNIDIVKGSLIEGIVDYLSVIQSFCGISCFVLVNLKTFLSDKEIGLFYKMVQYKKFNILLLENSIRVPRFSEEVLRIIDLALCEIF